jgi:hypothetical protein
VSNEKTCLLVQEVHHMQENISNISMNILPCLRSLRSTGNQNGDIVPPSDRNQRAAEVRHVDSHDQILKMIYFVYKFIQLI